jgi:hypothetical protein
MFSQFYPERVRAAWPRVLDNGGRDCGGSIWLQKR